MIGLSLHGVPRHKKYFKKLKTFFQ